MTYVGEHVQVASSLGLDACGSGLISPAMLAMVPAR